MIDHPTNFAAWSLFSSLHQSGRCCQAISTHYVLESDRAMFQSIEEKSIGGIFKRKGALKLHENPLPLHCSTGGPPLHLQDIPAHDALEPKTHKIPLASHIGRRFDILTTFLLAQTLGLFWRHISNFLCCNSLRVPAHHKRTSFLGLSSFLGW